MYYLGLDLGQRVDYSAIVVVERVETRVAFLEPRFEALLVRHLERVPLGSSYPDVVERVRTIVRSPALAGQCRVAVDGTGLGAPVVDMLRRAQLGCEVQSVTITGGDRESRYAGLGGSEWSVPKQDLMAGVQVLLEQGELKIAAELKEAPALLKELVEVSATHGPAGRLRIGADGFGQHDDLVIALSLACWSAQRKRCGMGNRRLL